MPDNNQINRPLLRYAGGKWQLAKWIISQMPAHRIYCEPFGGSAAVLLQKKPAAFEIYNDIDDRIVNLFQVMQSPEQAKKLESRLRWTLFSRKEFYDASEKSDDPVIDAHRILIRSWMGRGGLGLHNTSFKSNVTCKNYGTSLADSWQSWIETGLEEIRRRLLSVTIESRPALDVIAGHDMDDTLFYIDPPYPFSTRSRAYYTHEMGTDREHAELAESLYEVQGMVILSGYDCPLYDDLYKGWHTVYKNATAQNGDKRGEVLWLNPALKNALDNGKTPPLLKLINEAGE